MQTTIRFLRWGRHYEVGIPEIDGQHGQLVKGLNRLYGAHQSGGSREMIAGLLNDLAHLARQHFLTEEQMMERSNYGGLDAHRQDHRDFARKIAKLQKNIGRDGFDLSEEPLRYIRTWLRDHVLVADMRMAEHLKKHPPA